MSSTDGDYSDSDHDISRKPGNSRVLPSWASSSVSTNTGSRGSTQRFRPSKNFRNSNKWYTGKDGKPARVSVNQGTKSKNEVPPKDVKRMLPASLQSSSSSFVPSVPVKDATSSQIYENFRKPYSLRGSHSDVAMKNDHGTRLLPPSMNASMSVPSTKFVGQSDRYRPEVVQEEVGDERMIYQAAVQNLNQPTVEATLPDGLLSVSLFRHQRIALAWMLEKENSVACSGGILADDQGLGKTISIIALLKMHNFPLKPKSEHMFVSESEFLDLGDDDEKGTPVTNTSGSKVEIYNQKSKAGSLVVCPASVLRQWAHELDEKVADDAKLKVLIYHGLGRTKDPAELAKYDVVLTTYAIVAKEVPSKSFEDDDSEDDDSEDDQESKKRKQSCVSNKGKKGKKGISEDDLIDDDDYDDDEECKKRKQSRVSKKGKKGRKGISSSDYSDDDDDDEDSYDYDDDFIDDDDDSDVDRENRKKKKSRVSKKRKKGKKGFSATGALAKVKWYRVILDEAQTIKNHNTQVSKSCCELKAKKRWCLSGTPIQNSINELFSYFRFLKCEPYANYSSFCNQIKIPISKNSKQGYMKLQAVLKTIMLRRTKDTLIDGKPVINLPPKTVNLTTVDFSTEERAFYLKLEAESRLRFKEYAAAGTVRKNYANILLMLLRLRQACDHPLLVKGFSSESVSRVSRRTTKNLPEDTRANLLNLLDTLNICLLCSDPPEDAVITLCGHVFCYQCISVYITGDDNTCPSFKCKSQIGGDSVFSKSDLTNSISADDDLNSSKIDEESLVFQSDYCSSKIKATLDIIQSHCKSNNSIKAIVFSQWTRMLDLVETSLNQHCIDYRRLDGSMSLVSRDRAVNDFNTDLEVSVMLMSLKAGNVGLNMVAASHVIMLDLWWNPTTEDQAVDRAHRIGQTRPVTVSRLTIKDTVEDRILALQEEKRKIIASAFGEDKSGSSAASITAQDLKYLFMGAH